MNIIEKGSKMICRVCRGSLLQEGGRRLCECCLTAVMRFRVSAYSAWCSEKPTMSEEQRKAWDAVLVDIGGEG